MEPLEVAVEDEIDSAYASFERVGSRIARIEMIFRTQGIAWISEARGEFFFSPQNGGVLNTANLFASLGVKCCTNDDNLPSPLKNLCPT